jgi:lipoprotein-anchoring transpeptidase ErfK/SrfK
VSPGQSLRRSPVELRRAALGAAALVAVAFGISPGAARAAVIGCSGGAATRAALGRPTDRLAWRAGLEGRTAVYDQPGSAKRSAWVYFSEAPWLLVIGADRLSDGTCMVRVRLPWRPNGAAGWISSADVLLSPTPWRIAVSRSARTLTLTRSGRRVLRVRVVVGKASTPTPTGLFAVADAVPGDPNAFTGSWVLALTAHSDVLRRFDGGDGTVGIHGRGGTSLLDPLGSAASHGCIRLANDAVDALVDRIGRYNLPGTPVRVT